MYFCANVFQSPPRSSSVVPSPTSIGKSSPARQTTFHGAGSWKTGSERNIKISACRVAVAAVTDAPASSALCSERRECMLSEPVSNGMCRPVCVLLIFITPRTSATDLASGAALVSVRSSSNAAAPICGPSAPSGGTSAV